MRFLLFILVVSLGIIANAQVIQEHLYANEFVVGETYSIFKDGTSLLKKPTIDAKVKQELSVFMEVTVLQAYKETVTVSGEKTNWLKVKTASGKEGFIPSIRLSLGKLELVDGTHMLYRRRYISGEKLLMLERVLDVGNAMEKQAFDLDFLDFKISLHDHKGLEYIDHVIQLDVYNAACDIALKTSYLSINLSKNELFVFANTYNECSRDTTKISERLIFPADCDGVDGMVIYVSKKRKLLNERLNTYESRSYHREHKWASGSLYEPIQRFNWNKYTW